MLPLQTLMLSWAKSDAEDKGTIFAGRFSPLSLMQISRVSVGEGTFRK